MNIAKLIEKLDLYINVINKHETKIYSTRTKQFFVLQFDLIRKYLPKCALLIRGLITINRKPLFFKADSILLRGRWFHEDRNTHRPGPPCGAARSHPGHSGKLASLSFQAFRIMPAGSWKKLRNK